MSTNTKPLIEAVENISENFRKFRDANDERYNELAGRIEQFEAMADRPRAIHSEKNRPELKAAFNQYLHDRDAKAFEAKTISIAGGEAAGSGVVPLVIAAEILDISKEVSPLINEVRRSTSDSGDYRRVVNRKGLTSGWISETGSRAATVTPNFRTIVPPGAELYAYPAASSWAVQDSKFNLAELLIRDTGEEFGSQLEEAILFGSGSSEPLGMLTNAPVTTLDSASPERPRDRLRYVTGFAGSPEALHWTALVDAYFDLSASYRRNAIWVMNSATLAAVRKLRDLEDRPVWQPNLGAAVDASDGFLLGKRVVLSERMASPGGSPESFAILVGDFQRAYELVSVGAMQITHDDNLTQPGFHKWYVRQRFLGRLTDNNAIRAIAF